MCLVLVCTCACGSCFCVCDVCTNNCTGTYDYIFCSGSVIVIRSVIDLVSCVWTCDSVCVPMSATVIVIVLAHPVPLWYKQTSTFVIVIPAHLETDRNTWHAHRYKHMHVHCCFAHQRCHDLTPTTLPLLSQAVGCRNQLTISR